MSKRPIEPRDYLHGVKVVDIGDVRVARGQTRVPKPTCQHASLTYDEAERRVYCEDCESDVDNFDAFLLIVRQHDQAWRSIRRAHQQAQEALSQTVRSRAAKIMDAEWRKRNTVPACPHCREGLLPEDVTGNTIPTVSRELTERRRQQKNKS